MVLTIALWLSSLPFIALVVIIFFGRDADVYIGLMLLTLWLVVGWGLSGWYIIKKWFG